MNTTKTKKQTTAMARVVLLGLLMLLPMTVGAQRVLTLDSCRAMALRNNKQIGVAKTKQEINANLRKSARTKYLPQVNALGGHTWTSKEISILNDEQKSILGNLGVDVGGTLQNSLAPLVSLLPAPAQAKVAQDLTHLTGLIDQTGQKMKNAFRTDTRNMFAGGVVVTQPVYMGGAITAANKIADINEDIAQNSFDAQRQNTLYHIDQAYWQVVSLRYKQKLAESFLDLMKKLNSDVQRLIEEGVATKGDGLSISVKENDAEIALTKVSDGLALARMLLCQLCGLPIDETITLADEVSEDIAVQEITVQPDVQQAVANRPELKLLQNTVDLTQQTTKELKALNLPQVMLTGGYAVTNPNTFNGFEKKFGGFWNLGVLVRVPVWNWNDTKYKVRASQGATTIANLELADAREKIELQVNQSSFRVNEANKKLAMAKANIAHAEENLRTANIGFREGFVSTTTVMEAHTTWLSAQSQLVDAEIDVKLSQVELQKALGTLE